MADPSFVIARVAPDQWEAWRDIRLRALADTPDAFASTLEVERDYDDELWIGRCRTGSAGPTSAQFAAVADDKMVGMVAVITSAISEYCEPDQAELVSMWTAPEARGHGVGKALVDGCIEWASTTDGINALGLWVTQGNDGAQRLYQRCGFALTGDHQPLPSDPCKDEIRMLHPL